MVDGLGEINGKNYVSMVGVTNLGLLETKSHHEVSDYVVTVFVIDLDEKVLTKQASLLLDRGIK